MEEIWILLGVIWFTVFIYLLVQHFRSNDDDDE